MNKKNSKVTALQIYNDYKKGVQFKQNYQIEENERVSNNFYDNLAWEGLEHLRIPKPNTPITKFAVDRMRVEILKNIPNYTYTPEDVDSADEDLIKAGVNFTGMAKKVYSEINQKILSEDAVLASQLSGLGGVYYYWDSNKKGGNNSKYVGQIDGQVFSASDVILGDVKQNDKEKQPFIILPVRKTVKEAQKIADDNKKNVKVVPDSIDNNTNHNRYELDDKMVTVFMRFYKENGRVYHTMSTRTDFISDVIDLDIDVYPIALMHWERTRKHAYGKNYAQDIVETHRLVNGLDSARILGAQLHGNPILILPEGIKYSGKPGSAIKVKQATDAQGIKYLQPPSLNATQGLTTEFRETFMNYLGINENLTGSSNDDTAQAILLKLEASATQIDPARRNLQSFNRQIAEIYCGFFKSKYNDKRSFTEQNRGGDDVIHTFVGTDYRDVVFSINTGQSELSSKRLKHDSLRQDLTAGYITYRQFLELSDEEAVPYASEALSKLGSEEARQIIIQDMVADYLIWKPEVKRQFTGLSDEELTEAVIDLIVVDEEFMNLSVVPNEQLNTEKQHISEGLNTAQNEDLNTANAIISPQLNQVNKGDIEPLLSSNQQGITPLLG